MKKCLLALLLICLIVFLSGCENSNTNGTNPDWKRYVHKETGVSFLYPKTWKIPSTNEVSDEIKSLISQAEVIILAEDNPGANVNLIITKSPLLAPGAVEQVEATESMYEFFGDQMGVKNYRRIDLQEYTVGKFNVALLKYELTLAQADYTVIGKQLYVPVGQNTYILTCTAPKEVWGDYEPIFDVIIKSFSLD